MKRDLRGNNSRVKTLRIGFGHKTMGLNSTTIPGFFDYNQEEQEPDDNLPPEIYLPNTTQDGRMPRTGDIPYLMDFDDSGLDRFMEKELERARANY